MAEKARVRISHRERKNPRSAELFKEQKQIANASRNRQIFNVKTKTYTRVK